MIILLCVNWDEPEKSGPSLARLTKKELNYEE
jgi:hypothetical protein